MGKPSTQGVFVLVVGTLLCALGSVTASTAAEDNRVSVLSVTSVEELIDHYERHQYTLKDVQGGYHLVLQELPDDFDSIVDVELRKTLFQRIVLPLIYIENQRIASERDQLKELADRWRKRSADGDTSVLNSNEKQFVAYLLDRYDLEEKYEAQNFNNEMAEDLKRRINTIPPSLVLAQATNESGWGTSRFAIRGNNLFGVRSYDESTPGFKPKGVPDTSSFRVRKFPTLLDSVRNYMRTLNTHWAYEEFRKLRAKHTAEAPLKLVQGLSRYSERREEYMDRLVRLIKGNNYRRFDP